MIDRRLGSLLAWTLVLLLAAPAAAQNDGRCKGTKVWCAHLNRCTYPDACRKRTPTPRRKKGYRCDFKSQRKLCGWEIKSGPHCAVEYVDGKLRVRNVQTSGACFETYHPLKSHGDITVTARITAPSTDTAGLLIGEFWDIPEPERHFYTFQLYPSGEFGLWRFQHGRWESLGRQHSDAIRTTGFNELRLDFAGGNLSAWINGTWVASVAVTAPPKRIVGVYLNAPNVQIDLDWIEVKKFKAE